MEIDIARLSAMHESNVNPGAISDGSGDLGGASYGAFQFNSRDDIVSNFLNWVVDNYPDEALRNYAVVLSRYTVYSDAFNEKWVEIANADSEGFYKIQAAYAKALYFEPAVDNIIDKLGVDVRNRSKALQSVLMCRAIQYHPRWMPELFQSGVQYAIDNYGDNVKGVTCLDDCPDRFVISGIYEYLYTDGSRAYQTSTGNYHSPDDWVNGSADVVNSLMNRFKNERAEALDILDQEESE